MLLLSHLLSYAAVARGCASFVGYIFMLLQLNPIPRCPGTHVLRSNPLHVLSSKDTLHTPVALAARAHIAWGIDTFRILFTRHHVLACHELLDVLVVVIRFRNGCCVQRTLCCISCITLRKLLLHTCKCCLCCAHGLVRCVLP